MSPPRTFPARALLVPLTVWLVMQAATGWLLSVYFRPEPADAIASLHEIQYLVTGGAMVRALHHYGATLVVAVSYAYATLVLVRGGYARRFQWGWWTMLLLLATILGLGFTGYLLPWDNHAYWAMRVGVELIGLMPVVGESLLELLRGGPEYGPATLRRLFSIHTMVLPVLACGALWLHWIASGSAAPPTGTSEES